MQLVERYDLRAADALQLAAALGWCEDAPQGRVFLTADRKLREAVLLSGFDAKEIRCLISPAIAGIHVGLTQIFARHPIRRRVKFGP